MEAAVQVRAAQHRGAGNYSNNPLVARICCHSGDLGGKGLVAQVTGHLLCTFSA
jgi:hypothetical protein